MLYDSPVASQNIQKNNTQLMKMCGYQSRYDQLGKVNHCELCKYLTFVQKATRDNIM